jgi:UDP-N-acetylmuramate dehydrogenase
VSACGCLRDSLHGPRGVTPPATDLPRVRGTLTPGRPLADLTWLRVGGPADWLFQPADEADLAAFLSDLAPDVPVFPLGLGSNLIVRDGGLPGVVVRLGRGFNAIRVDGETVTAGAGAPDSRVAQAAAAAGVDLGFLRTIPGSIGGAVRMNAGCYGRYVADAFVAARAVTRRGEVVELTSADLAFAYRSTTLPPETIIVDATLTGPRDAPDAIASRMASQLARRDETQPTKDRSAGSTFRNPAGFSSTGLADDVHDRKAWRLIEAAGMTGATLGAAQMSPKHANFLVNTGGATAAELEELGELVRKKVLDSSGISLDWEIMRVGRTR